MVAGGVAQFDTVTVREQATSPDAMRVAALLHVTDGAFPILLAGVYAAAGAGLADVVSGSQVWVNAPRDAAAPAAAYSAIEVTGRVPLGVETLAGAAIDAAHAAPDMLDSIVRAVRMGGRIVAPADTPMPVGVKELARDAHEWVAEVTTRASGLVELRRRAPDAVG